MSGTNPHVSNQTLLCSLRISQENRAFFHPILKKFTSKKILIFNGFELFHKRLQSVWILFTISLELVENAKSDSMPEFSLSFAVASDMIICLFFPTIILPLERTLPTLVSVAPKRFTNGNKFSSFNSVRSKTCPPFFSQILIFSGILV